MGQVGWLLYKPSIEVLAMSSKKYLSNSSEYAYPSDKNQVTGGLTKREYFAGLAIQGLLANPQNSDGLNFQEVREIIASKAVAMADVLLSELDK